MGHCLVIVKSLTILVLNIVLNFVLLSLGGWFILLTFCMPIVNLMVIELTLKKAARWQRVVLTFLLTVALTISPIEIMSVLGDAGSVVFMVIFTFFLVTIPLAFIGIAFLFRSNICKKTNMLMIAIIICWQIIIGAILTNIGT